eukprot:TRINITY_DN3535_c0_g1_i2.p1 TRINITY_DN3535_c0_g1~~TRINITY_DN3535_c0_g1_i2.p1  ORF type:complete len:117 (-),score=15.88 TRINITY_DN3535_c0_g1_i2:268-570(-)
MQSKSDQESIPNVENITDETKSEEGEAKNSLLSADFLKSIENDARHCSENLISMMSNLQTSLHAVIFINFTKMRRKCFKNHEKITKNAKKSPKITKNLTK